jgi:hypothetical protein
MRRRYKFVHLLQDNEYEHNFKKNVHLTMAWLYI